MSKVKIEIPKKMQWLLWSYDIDSLDLEGDKDYIITQVLNYGTWEDLKWLFKVYSEREIKNVVKKPARGLWFRDVLNFWNLMLNLKLKKRVFEEAILDLQKYAR